MLYQSSRVWGSLFGWGEDPREKDGTSFEATEREEINVYHVKSEGVTREFLIGIKLFKVTTKSDNIFQEE